MAERVDEHLPDDRVKDVLLDALDCPSGERDALLARACARDHALRERVECLIRSHERAAGFMGEPERRSGPVEDRNRAEPAG